VKRVAATQHSLRLTKHFPYKADAAQAFTNRYYFDGASPGDSDAWHTLFDAIVLLEKTIFSSAVTIVKADGFGPGSDLPLAGKTYTTVGTGAFSAGSECPGDCAIVSRHATTKLSIKNHTVYVFSYYHGVFTNAATSGAAKDQVFPAQKTAVDNYAALWVSGISVAGRTYKRTTPDGHLVTGHQVDPFVGHRDFLG
jgi:hypothetical protein